MPLVGRPVGAFGLAFINPGHGAVDARTVSVKLVRLFFSPPYQGGGEVKSVEEGDEPPCGSPLVRGDESRTTFPK